jgi:hypothetical protein
VGETDEKALMKGGGKRRRRGVKMERKGGSGRMDI